MLYKGVTLDVRKGEWSDPKNADVYTVIDQENGYLICVENETKKMFAIEKGDTD